MDAETSGSDLDDGIFTITVKILVETAFAGIVKDSQFCGCQGKGFVGIVADGTIAHGRKHNGHGKIQLGRKLAVQLSFCIAAYSLWLFSQIGSGFHWFPQRINGGICYLGGIDQYFIPVNGEGLGIAHRRKKNAPAVCLFIDLFDRTALPVGVFPERTVGFYDLQRSGWTEGNAPLAVYAF